MAMQDHHGSAKIYQFPRRPRVAMGGRSPAARGFLDTPQRAFVPEADFDSWYHEAAIRDAARTPPTKLR